jgi:hypothetical protein
MSDKGYSQRLAKAREYAEKYMDKVKEFTFWMSIYTAVAINNLRHGLFTAEQAADALEKNTPHYKDLAAPSVYGLYTIVSFQRSNWCRVAHLTYLALESLEFFHRSPTTSSCWTYSCTMTIRLLS